MTTNPVDLESLRGHTPGPWEEGTIAHVYSRGMDNVALPFEQRRANSRLISAAPALLAELTERRAHDAKVAELVEALESIRQYGRDTLSGPCGRFERGFEWHRESVVEMTSRAARALAAFKEPTTTSHSDERNNRERIG